MRERRLQKIASVALLVMTWVADASGYELLTHQRITRTAFEQSVLKRGYLEEELQFSSTGVLRWGEEERDVRGWLAEGSVREDDPFRFLNHFYDPEGDRGLRSLCGVGLRAFDWAFDQPTQPEEFRFSWSDARRLFLTALTDPSPREREAAMARTFRTLGDVVHLVQDMGSPEHTRNDPHAGVGLFGVFLCGAPSLFEREIEGRVNSFNYSGYPQPSFSQFRGFWTTGDGRGFAEFTNRNFVSKGTNFTRTEEGNTGEPSFGVTYPSPRLRLGLREDVDIQALIPGTDLRGSVTFFGNDVDDRATGQVIRNPWMTTYSLFDAALRQRLQNEIFTINRFNVTEAAKILLPRAVGYSAGLLDYFFRGTLDFHVQASAAGATGKEIAITNTSAEAMAGTFTLYAEDANERRSEVASFELSLGAGATSTSPLTFPAPSGVQAYVLVFQGGLGAEAGAVAGRFKRAPAPANTFFVWHVKFHNDQFDHVNRLSSAGFVIRFGGPEFAVQVVESFFSSGSHQGLRRHYLLFALVHEPNRPLPPLDVSDLGVTAQLSSAPSRASGLAARAFHTGALGIIELEVPQLVVCDPQPSPRMLTVARLLRSVETNHYLIQGFPENIHLIRPPLGTVDTGISTSDLLLTPTLRRVSFEQLQGIVRDLHPRLTLPPSFPQTAAAYAVAEFDVPNVDSWTVSEGGNRCFVNDRVVLNDGTVLPPPTFASVVRVAAMWDVEDVTVRLRDGTTIGLSDGQVVGDVRGVITGLTSHDVFGAEYQRTAETTLLSPTFSFPRPPESFFQSFRHNPDDPFGPLIEIRR